MNTVMLARAEWDEAAHVRGKTTPGSRGGSFAPSSYLIPVGNGRKVPIKVYPSSGRYERKSFDSFMSDKAYEYGHDSVESLREYDPHLYEKLRAEFLERFATDRLRFALAFADEMGRVYVSWDESKHPRDDQGQWATNGLFRESLNIERKDIPQIRGAYKEEFFQYARGKGVSVSQERVAVSVLKPAQKHFNPLQTAQMPMASLNYPLMVSSDNYVLDGTNRYVRILKDSPGGEVNVDRIGLEAKAALALMRSFPKAETKDISHIGASKILALADAMGKVYAEWDESKHPRGKTTPGSRGGSFISSDQREVGVIVERALKDPLVIEANRLNAEFGDVRDRLGLLDKDGNYTVEGTMMRERISNSFLTQDAIPVQGEHPVATIMIGRPGSGKSTILEKILIPSGLVPKSVMINPDLVMEEVPGYAPILAPSYHPIASDTAKDLLRKAVRGGYNLVYDSTGKDPKKMGELADSLNELGYRTNIVWADATGQVAVQRVYSRFLTKRRYVPMYVAAQDYSGLGKSYEVIKSKYADEWSKYDTSGDAPRLIQSGSRTSGISKQFGFQHGRSFEGGGEGETGGGREADAAESSSGSLQRSVAPAGGEGQAVGDYAAWDASKHPRAPSGSDKGGEFVSTAFSDVGDETGQGTVKAGDTITVFRLGTREGLVNANAGNAEGVALHLARLQDPEGAVGLRPAGEVLWAYRVELGEDPGRYVRINNRAPDSESKDGAHFGRSQDRLAVSYSFLNGGNAKITPLLSIPLSDVMVYMKEKYGYPDFDYSGGNAGGKVIREVFRTRLVSHSWDESKHSRDEKGQWASGGGDLVNLPLRKYLTMMSNMRQSGGGGTERIDIEGFVLKNGQAFQSPVGLSGGIKPMKLGVCYMNAYQLADSHPELTYVEGWGSYKGIPMMHAWTVDAQNHVVDPTWVGRSDYTPEDHRYFGVKIPIETVWKTISARGKDGVLDDPEQGFPIVRGEWKKFGQHRYAIERPLYVSRPVENADEIIAWATSVGFETTLPAEDMYVTVCYSKEPVDWLGLDHDDVMLETPPEGVRTLAWDESKHPRDLSGGESGGQFLPKGQIRTSEFRSWFGDSVVTDTGRPGGKPLVVYHGTRADMEAFRPSKDGGIYFTLSEDDAQEFADVYGGTVDGNAKIVPVYLSFMNPLNINAHGELFEPAMTNRYIAEAKTGGHDGVIVRNIQNFEGGATSDTYIAFRPEQIKFAVGKADRIDPKSFDYADRTISQLGDEGAIVLQFESAPLQARHQYFLDHGASWDYDAYHPHITLTYAAPEGLDLSTIEPYTGRIVLGPEQFAELETGWAEDIKEHAEEDGVWRTVRGRHIFIRTGEDFDTALKRSLGGDDKSTDDPITWPVFKVDPNKIYDLYHVTSDVSNLSSIVKEGFVPGKTSLMGDDSAFGHVYFTRSRVQADSIISQIKEGGGSPAMLQLRLSGKHLSKLSPRIDQRMGADDSIAVRPNKSLLLGGVLNIYVPKGADVPSGLKERVHVFTLDSIQIQTTSIEIDYTQIKNDLDSMEAKFRDELRLVLAESRDAVMATIKRNKGSLPKDYQLPYTTDIQQVIGDALQRAMDRGGADASKEIGRAKKDYAEEQGGRWITMNGRHVFIREGETPEQALARGSGAEVEFVPKKVTDDDKAIMGDYQMDSWDLNKRLWSGKPLRRKAVFPANVSDLELVRGMDTAWDHGAKALPEDLVVYRGSKQGFSGAGEFVSPAFVSVSSDRKEAERWGTVTEVRLPKGTRVLRIADYIDDAQQELVLPRSSKFRMLAGGGLEYIGRVNVKSFSFLVTYASVPTFSPKAAIKWLKEKAFWVADVLTGGLEEDIRLAIINGLKYGTPTDEIVTNIAQVYIPYLGDPTAVKNGELPTAARLETVVRTNLTESYNQGRINTFVKPDMMPFLDGIRYSAILDSRTTPVCQFLHEKIFKPEDIVSSGLTPGNHFNCRSLVVPVVVGEISKPPDYKVDPKVYITDAEILHAQSLADAKFLEQEDVYEHAEEENGVWRTVRGRHVFIREGETPSKAIKRSVATRTARSLQSHIPATKERQLKAAKYEESVARLINGKNLDDNEPFDVIKGRNAVEVKALLSGKNPKLTMHPDALLRKNQFLRKEKMTGHTVAIDARGDKPIYYYAQGVGSFRLSGMQQVKASELKGLIK